MQEWQWALAVAFSSVVFGQIAYLAGTAAAAAVFALSIDVVSLGTGPTIAKVRVRGATLRIAPLILQAYVRFSTASATLPRAHHTFDAAPWWQRLICVMAGPLAMIVAATPLLGGDAFNIAASALQFVGALVAEPLQVIDFTAAMNSIIHEDGPWTAIAHAMAFVGGVQFLPIGLMAGGAAIIHFSEAFHGGPLPLPLLEWIYRLSFAAGLILFVAILIAIVR